MAITGHFTVSGMDAKNEGRGTRGPAMVVYFVGNDLLTVAQIKLMGGIVLSMLTSMLTGGYWRMTATIDVELDMTPPEPYSDNEEGGQFRWITQQTNGDKHYTTQFLRTFNEDFIVLSDDDPAIIDVSHPDVAAWVTLMIYGFSGNPVLMTFSDYRGADIIALQAAIEYFG